MSGKLKLFWCRGGSSDRPLSEGGRGGEGVAGLTEALSHGGTGIEW